MTTGRGREPVDPSLLSLRMEICIQLRDMGMLLSKKSENIGSSLRCISGVLDVEAIATDGTGDLSDSDGEDGWSVSRSLNIPTWWTRERWRTLILVVVNAGRRRTRAIAVSNGAGTTMVMTIKTLSSEVISCTIHSHSLPLYYRAPQASKTAVFLVSELRLELAVKPGVTADKVVAAGAEGVVVTRDIRCGRTSTVRSGFCR